VIILGNKADKTKKIVVN